MKIIFKSILIITVFLIALIALAQFGMLNKIAPKIIESYLNNEIKFEDFNITAREINFSKAEIKRPLNQKINIHQGNLKWNLSFNKLPQVNLKFNANKIQLFTDNNLLLEATLNSYFTKRLFADKTIGDITFSTVSGKAFSQLSHNVNPNGEIFYKYTKIKNITNIHQFDIKAAGQEHLSSQGELKSDKNGAVTELKGNLEVKNLPLSIINLMDNLPALQNIGKQLQNYLKVGFIKSGNVNFNLDIDSMKHSKLLEENLKGHFVFQNVEVKYLPNYPVIRAENLELSLKGNNISLIFPSGLSNEVLINHGKLDLEWLGIKDSKILLNCNAKGPLHSLVDYIPISTYQKLVNEGIDLKQLKGEISTHINLVIPLIAPNNYDIVGEINNASIDILDKAISLSQGKLHAYFKDKSFGFSGPIKINGFNSNIEYINYLEDNHEFDQKLNAQINLDNANNKQGFIKLNSGKALLNFIYSTKSEVPQVSLKSDLTNLEFYIDKIGIHKKLKEKAYLEINQVQGSNLKEKTMRFKLTGDHNLKLIGQIDFLPLGERKININTLEHRDTKLKAKIEDNKKLFKATLSGECLDLSQANMLQFLEKEQSNISTDLRIDITRVKLKNGSELKNFKYAINCDAAKCYAGYMDSILPANKSLHMNLTNHNEQEQWTIECNDLGYVTKGIDIYSKLKGGNLLLIIETKRKEIKPGEIIPITEGNFTLTKFAISDVPFLTRLVSWLSLPGLTSTIVNNQSVAFNEMKGKFNYYNHQLRILESAANGAYFDFTLKGYVDTYHREIHFKGGVMPSLYGITNFIKLTPIIGKIFSAGQKKRLFAAPFKLNQKY